MLRGPRRAGALHGLPKVSEIRFAVEQQERRLRPLQVALNPHRKRKEPFAEDRVGLIGKRLNEAFVVDELSGGVLFDLVGHADATSVNPYAE